MENLESLLLMADDIYNGLKMKCEVSISADSKFDKVMKPIYNRLLAVGRDSAEAAEDAVIHYCLGKWRLYKTAYTFNPSFFKALIDSEDTAINTEQLRRLPCPAFFLSCPSESGAGSFVVIEPLDNGDCLIAVASVGEVDEEGRRLSLKEHSIWFHNGETVNSALARLVNQAKEQENAYGDFSNMLDVNSSAVQGYVEPLSRAILAAYYLAAKNADVKPVKTAKKNKLTRSNGKPLNIKKWEVGFRIGQEFEKMYRVESNDSDGPAKPRASGRMRPHLRRAHWHHYWTGKGRTTLTLNWIAPTYINGKDDIIATEHKTKTGEGAS